MRRLALSLVLCLFPLALAPLSAQKKVPKRPRLEAGSDTNHAGIYYSHGLRVLERRPADAADAFYWASRLDPSWAQPFYARRIALLMADPNFLVRYWTSNSRRFYTSKEVLSIDSLELRARMLNPYVIRELDRQFVIAFLTASWEQDLQRMGYRPDQVSRSELSFYIERMLQADASVWTKARFAASERRFPEALDLYKKALKQNKDDAAEIHEQRARIFYLIGNDDSARVEMQLALEQMRTQDEKDFVRLYLSKAVLEHSVGMAYERSRNFAAARDAYGRALQEDLSYYPAHVRLGLLALAAGDTATASTEFALAVEIRGDEPSLLYTYGAVLADMGKFEEATTTLQRAVAAEPFYAPPYYLLGRVNEAAQKPAEALRYYQDFVARAHGRHADLAHARARVTALTAVAGKP